MKRLSKKQKLEAYTYALLCIYDYLSRETGYDADQYVCNNLGRWINKNENKCTPFNIKQFPEFLLQRPTETTGSWWNIDEMHQRILAVKRAIQLTEQLKK